MTKVIEEFIEALVHFGHIFLEMQSVEDSIVRNYVLSFRVQCLVTLEAVRQIARYMQNIILLYIHAYFKIIVLCIIIILCVISFCLPTNWLISGHNW